MARKFKVKVRHEEYVLQHWQRTEWSTISTTHAPSRRQAMINFQLGQVSVGRGPVQYRVRKAVDVRV